MAEGQSPPVKPATLRFEALWAAYPDDPPYVDARGNVPKGYENQCAIKVSVSLHGAGVDLSKYPGATVFVKGKRLAIRAQELAGWLRRQPVGGLLPPAVNVTGRTWQERVKGKTGLLYFQDYWARAGEARTPTGDHIDLWNKST